MNMHVSTYICDASYEDILNEDMMDRHESRTELDTHANMVVIGHNSQIISRSGRTVQVSPFTPDYQALPEVPIVDATIAYECPLTGKVYILLCRDALYVPKMENNLIPPFILREAGIEVNDVPKIQVDNPTERDHSIFLPNGNLRIPLSLHGVFSYFVTRRPTDLELQDVDDIFTLTPDGSWNPHNTAYQENEENMVDWKGHIIEEKVKQRILLKDIHVDPTVVSSVKVSQAEEKFIDDMFSPSTVLPSPVYDEMPFETDEYSSNLANISSIFTPQSLYYTLQRSCEDSKFKSSIGATNTNTSHNIFDSDPIPTPDNETFDAMIKELGRGDLNSDDNFDDIMVSATHAENPKGVSADMLSKIWRIDLESAKRTLDVTSQHLHRSDNPNLSRNYSTNDRMLRYKRINQWFYMDTFFATSKAGTSTRGNSCCQLFVTDKGFLYVVPMKSKGEVPQALKQFAKEIGAPDAFICDHSGEQTSKEVRQFCHKIGTTLRVLEEGTPWANRAELYIGLTKEAVRKDMKEAGCALAFWDYCTERRVRINNLTARNLFQLDGRNAHFSVTGEEGDISNICQFGWYQWCYYREKGEKFPFNREVLGRVLGPAKGEGNEMAQWILKANGNVVPRRTLRPLNEAEISSEIEIKKRLLYDSLIERRWGTAISAPPTSENTEDNFVPYEDDDETPRLIPEMDDPVDANGKAINSQPAYDQLIHAELQLPHRDKMDLAKVIGRSIGPDGKTTGTYNDQPQLNTVIYDVEFEDGEVKEYAANVIAENMLSQVDEEGFSNTLFDCIVDHRKDDSATPKSDMYVTTKRGARRIKKSTRGWKHLVRWKDGSEAWIPLKDLKESHPIEVAEYATARGINDEPAYAWWVPYTLRKRDVIISAVHHRIRKTTHKYGFEIPTDYKHACEIDAKNGNTLWRDAIRKEMTDNGVAFEILEADQHVPVGWRKVTGHLIYDVKMDFTRKARWVLDGHKTPNPTISTYAGVVSRDSIRIAFTYAALNDIDVWAADIKTAYLQAPSSQKDFIICGSEFGLENVGKRALIHRALYGGKSAGRDFRNHLRSCMRHMGFTSCLADPDVWLRPAKKNDGSEYYEYVLLYTDDALVISDNGESILRNEIGKYFELKESSIGPPKIYLGGHVRKVELSNGVKCYAFSSSQYVQAAVSNVEETLKDKEMRLPTRAETPIRTEYRPELDTSSELEATDAAWYQSLIGILRWMVELGRVDICLEVSMLSSHLALPRQGHLEQVLHIFAHLKKYHNTEMVFDPSDPIVDTDGFHREDWSTSEFGHLGTEELPSNAPVPRGLGFLLRAFVDADHAADVITRRSRTGFMVFLNNAPIYWMSKKQNSVETSSFGSEFMAMKHVCEYLRGLRYKLRMMGIPCDGPSYIFGDNQSVLHNTTSPDSTLKKKSQSIAYHFVREGSARDEWRTTYINTHDNPSDLLTKVLPAGEKRRRFVRMILHHIFGTVD